MTISARYTWRMTAHPRVERDAASDGGWDTPGSTPELRRDLALNLADAFEAFERRQAFWWAHYPEFSEKYPEQYVAVRDGEVVFTTESFEVLMAWAVEYDFVPGVDYDSEFMTRRSHTWNL